MSDPFSDPRHKAWRSLYEYAASHNPDEKVEMLASRVTEIIHAALRAAAAEARCGAMREALEHVRSWTLLDADEPYPPMIAARLEHIKAAIATTDAQGGAVPQSTTEGKKTP